MTKTFKEYEEAPSGSVFFYNYKEPLMKFEQGFGFMGALIADATSGQVQCHFCGEWFDSLASHLRREHSMSVLDYKMKVGLNKKTALISEAVREKIIMSMKRNWAEGKIGGLRPVVKGSKRSQEIRDRVSAGRKIGFAERQNNTNTCPEQLLERLVSLYNEKGRILRIKEIPFREALTRVYGSYKNACELVGIPHRKPGQHVVVIKLKWTRENIIKWVHDFYTTNNRFPKTEDMPGDLPRQLQREGRENVYDKALVLDGQYRAPIGKIRVDNNRRVEFSPHYDPAMLIIFMRNFEKIHNRKPSQSDSRRGLLPKEHHYIKNFGSWREALNLAFA